LQTAGSGITAAVMVSEIWTPVGDTSPTGFSWVKLLTENSL